MRRVAAAAAARPAANTVVRATAPAAERSAASGVGVPCERVGSAWDAEPAPPLPEGGIPAVPTAETTGLAARAAPFGSRVEVRGARHAAAAQPSSHAMAWEEGPSANTSSGYGTAPSGARKSEARPPRSRWDATGAGFTRPVPTARSESTAHLRPGGAAAQSSELQAGMPPPLPPSTGHDGYRSQQHWGSSAPAPPACGELAKVPSQSAPPPPPLPSEEVVAAQPMALSMSLGGSGMARPGGQLRGSTGAPSRSGLAAAVAARPARAAQPRAARGKVAGMFGHDSSGDEG